METRWGLTLTSDAEQNAVHPEVACGVNSAHFGKANYFDLTCKVKVTGRRVTFAFRANLLRDWRDIFKNSKIFRELFFAKIVEILYRRRYYFEGKSLIIH